MGERIDAVTCPACHRFETTSIPEFVSGCLSCEARAIATSDAAKSREAHPTALTALMRTTWPEQKRFLQGRPMMWDWLKKLSAKEMTE